MPNNYLRLYYHLIWKTWDHLPFLTPEVCAVVYPVLLEKVRELGGETLALGGVEDHVHMLVWLPATVEIAEVVKVLKGVSSTLHGWGFQTEISNGEERTERFRCRNRFCQR